MHVKSVVDYLVENGFLSKMIDYISSLFDDIRIEYGLNRPFQPRRDKNNIFPLECVLQTDSLLYSCLRVSLKVLNVECNYRSELFNTGSRLIRFCVEFDSKQFYKIKERKYQSSFISFLIDTSEIFFQFLSGLVKLLVKYDEIAQDILESFIKRLYLYIDNDSNNNDYTSAIQQLINNSSIDKDTFCIYNLSRRIFADIFMRFYSKRNSIPEIIDESFRDEKMLMWMAIPIITTLAFVSKTSSMCWGIITEKSYFYGISYLESDIMYYMQMQDLNIIQIIISHMNLEVLLRYFLFPICPSLREHVMFFHPISSMLSSNEFPCCVILRYLLILLYNSLLERHFIGDFPHPDYQFEERKVIHILALEHPKFEGAPEKYKFFRDTRVMKKLVETKNFDPIVEEVTCFTTDNNGKKKYTLKPEYANLVNVFYFLYTFLESRDISPRIMNLYEKKGCKFMLPKIPELREAFIRMNDFMFSNAFCELFLSVLVEWHRPLVPNGSRASDNLVITSMTICLMLKVSLDHKIYTGLKKTIDFVFDVQKKLGDINILIFLVQAGQKEKHACFSSVIDYLVQLSRIRPESISSLPTSPSDWKKRSHECRNQAQKVFQNELLEVSNISKEEPLHKRDITREL
ncbi:hypothetical protein RF11_03866 [Thelohanellus kitauei]|uniref:E3 ubiquitin-protein ligase UBR1-like winged-helix domain-containing protein n=1 Tax=Thelohanellus kitauei TaxID=669202 RepID=A0A0C2MJD2_THEKT|nr:hypothetical protein RF11_03866 [Thelohanellus kitauei]